MIDFHTHILPNMDDGSNSVQTSLKLLDILQKEGVKLVCLTSHFYPSKESIIDFLQRREKSFESLDYNGDLKLKLGSEVHYYRGISQSEDIGKLCIQDSNVILLELSFSMNINDNVINDIFNLYNRGYKVVLAHIERYNIAESLIRYLKDNGIYIQSNSEFFNNKFTSLKAINWLEKGYIDVLGSDCHNVKDRLPNYEMAVKTIKNRLGEQFFNIFSEKAYKIIGEQL